MKAEGRKPKAERGVGRGAGLATMSVAAFCLLLSAIPIGLTDWRPVASDGVSLRIVPDGGAMRLDVDFHGGGGYVIARREVTIDLPENYEFAFRVRGDLPPNNLELKLIDSTGDNVWWMNRHNFEFPREWTLLRTKKRHIEFAWGPSRGGVLRHVAAIEIAISAGTGGKGSVWIDDFRLTQLDPESEAPPVPVTRAAERTIELDFGRRAEFGGLVVDWESDPGGYAVELSGDGAAWTEAWRARATARPVPRRDFIYLPEAEARLVRIRTEKEAAARVGVRPLAFSKSKNDFFEAIADDAPPGRYPKYFSNAQSYWTVAGAPNEERELLINEEGMVETDAGRFSIEPFLFVGGTLVTWADVKTRQTLEEGDLPIPRVEWDAGAVKLDVRVDYPAVLYRITAREPVRGKLFLAIRPFQVDPPWQFLAVSGGVASLGRIALEGTTLRADEQTWMLGEPPAGFGAAAFVDGDVAEYLARGILPPQASVEDPFGAASAALQYDFSVAPGEARVVRVVVSGRSGETMQQGKGGGARRARPSRSDAVSAARNEPAALRLDLPAEASDLVKTLRSNIAYILINQDGPAIQPGSRSYDRSWIRDGALTSAALLRVGESGAVRRFIEWYAGFQYPNGKIPCCVDARGADPVPEHDSHGEFIYLVAEYCRLTGDVDLARRMWPRVRKAVEYIDFLRKQRMTKEYEGTAFYGLMPESISHEGYSAKAMHSYWDDFFTLRGLGDAVELAQVLGEPHEDLATMRDEFRRHLLASIALAMKTKNIDYIPGSVELGDFDPTSTTIAISPGGELQNLPRDAVLRTFEKYYDSFVRRRDGTLEWDAYTPYELRAVGTFIHLGWRDRAHELLDFFMRDRRPAGWNHWAEVVWRDAKTPKFIGDMPHTWVGSDFIRSFLDMLAYERESDGTLLIAEGLPDRWLERGVRVEGLVTRYGRLGFSIKGNDVNAWGIRPPPGGVLFRGKPVRIRLPKQ